jgi:hypothetical protein
MIGDHAGKPLCQPISQTGRSLRPGDYERPVSMTFLATLLDSLHRCAGASVSSFLFFEAHDLLYLLKFPIIAHIAATLALALNNRDVAIWIIFHFHKSFLFLLTFFLILIVSVLVILIFFVGWDDKFFGT